MSCLPIVCILNSNSSKSKKESAKTSTFGDLEIGDIDDLDEDLGDLHLGPTVTKSAKAVDARPITMKQAMVSLTEIFHHNLGGALRCIGVHMC